MNIGKLQRVALRDVWPREDADFSCWLQGNLDVLGEAIGLELISAETEQLAGAFRADLLAQDVDGRTVVIENQLEPSNHDHLGKVLTYLVAMDAVAAVWIASDPHPEHVAVIQWLNESMDTAFYMVKVEAVRIGDSAPAALLTRIVGPSEEARSVGEAKRGLSETARLQQEYWTQTLEKAREKTQLFANISPQAYSWIGTGAGITGLALNFGLRQHQGQVELYIDRATGDGAENKAIFDWLYEHREEIENLARRSLDWERLPDKRASRVRIGLECGGYRDTNWDESQEALIEAMICLERGLRPYLEQLSRRGLAALNDTLPSATQPPD